MKTVILFYNGCYQSRHEQLLGLFTYVVLKNGFAFVDNGKVKIDFIKSEFLSVYPFRNKKLIHSQESEVDGFF